MIPYIINAGLILTGCLAFYKILLTRETFYRLNRYTLIICLVVSFSLPLVRVPQQWSFRKAEQTTIVSEPQLQATENNKAINAQVNTAGTESPQATSTSNGLSLQQAMTWLVYLYWFGVIVFGLNFLLQIGVLLYRAYARPVIIDGKFRIVEVSGDKAPCSFGNNIFINPEKYEWETYTQILQHEKVHVRQGHSFDILLAEIVLIFQWFNPFAWLYRKEVENNLEFLTDDQMVQHEKVEAATYQLSLLKVSAPHFPLSVTTNYNQSLLKKRIAMMNAKKSNMHTTWKYFFLLPLLVLLACLLNEPMAYAQEQPSAKKNEVKRENSEDKKNHGHEMKTEGFWFATIKNDKIQISFKNTEENDRNSYNGSTFDLSEFPNLPRGAAGTFSLTREPGTMEFNGKFEGNEGMGRYKFTPNKQYADHMKNEGIGTLHDEDLMVFYFVNIKKDYVQMLKGEGYANIRKNDLIPLAALNVDKPFISSIRESGYKKVELGQLIPLRALKIDGNYIREIREAGYGDIDLDNLVAFKAQGIDKEYLSKMRKSNIKPNANNNSNENSGNNRANPDQGLSAHDVIRMKALKVDDEFINSFKEVGYTNLRPSQLVPMKSLGITPDYIKGFQSMGYKDIDPEDIIPLKAQKITPEYIRSFEALGFKDISLNQIVAVKAMKITPEYISSMKQKGFDYNKLEKYVQLKSVTE
jgi:hypothetical protein